MFGFGKKKKEEPKKEETKVVKQETKSNNQERKVGEPKKIFYLVRSSRRNITELDTTSI